VIEVNSEQFFDPEAAIRKIKRLEGALDHAVNRIRELEDTLASKLPSIMDQAPVMCSVHLDTVTVRPTGGWFSIIPAYKVPKGPRRNDVIRDLALAYARKHTANFAAEILKQL